MNQKFILTLIAIVSFSISAISQSQSIGLSLDDVKANKGEQVCLPVTVYGFQQMLSMQYSIRFDPAQLEFQGIVNRQLPYLSDSNFGTHSVQNGILTVVWIDNSLKGVSKEEGEQVFTLCFRVKADKGTKAEVNFSKDPTPFESVNLAEQLVQINTKKGVVSVQ